MFAAWLFLRRPRFELIACALFGVGWMLLFLGMWPYIKSRGFKPVWVLWLVLLCLPLFFVFTIILPDRRRGIGRQ